jgi:hypothetical protein
MFLLSGGVGRVLCEVSTGLSGGVDLSMFVRRVYRGLMLFDRKGGCQRSRNWAADLSEVATFCHLEQGSQ